MAVHKVSLALQGGGAHGAFTWGVLERLLEEESLEFEGVTGTSAGAMNALMLAQGWIEDGRTGAIQKLELFWKTVAERSPSRWLGMGGRATQSINHMLMALSKQVSPYGLNPLNYDPLREIVTDLCDFSVLRGSCPFKLFIAATQVKTGKIRLFRESELDELHVLASACLPTMQKAVIIDGEPYWDGGFSGNPAVYPLVFDCGGDDILIVHLQPLSIEHTPDNATQISDRVAEIGFQSTFLREMRAIAYTFRKSKKAWLSRLLPGTLERRFKRLRFHMIESTEYMSTMPRLSRCDTRWIFLNELKSRGKLHAERWLAKSGDLIGRASSFDIEEAFL